MFKVAVGHGLDPDSVGAAEEALKQCAQAIDGETVSAGILITAIDFEYDTIIHKIRQVHPDILLIGGTSAGEMSSAVGFQQDSVMLMLFCSDEVAFQVGSGQQASQDSAAAAKEAVAQATAQSNQTQTSQDSLKLCYALGDGLSVDGVAMVEGLREATNYKTPIIGGLSADDWNFKATYQFISTPSTTEVLQDAVVILTFAGNLNVSYGVASGQRPTGPKGVVTKSKGNTVYEIDGSSPIDFYASTLGVEEVKLMGSSGWSGAIAVYEADGNNFYVRSPNNNAYSNDSISYFGHIPEQSVVQLVETDNNSLLSSAKEAFQDALKTYQGEAPTASLVISCGSRLQKLGTRIEQEYAIAKECLNNEIPMIGFHSFGEISPFAAKSESHFHNDTFIALLIGNH